jgi:hypothetical protein
VTHPHTKALAELVACKNLKDKAERGVTVAGNAEQRGMCASFEEQASAFAEYARRQPLAWDAARAALASPQEQAPGAEPVAEVVLFGGDLKEVSWKKGKLPPVGTKLYTTPSSPGAAEAGEAHEFQLHAQSSIVICKRCGQQQWLVEKHKLPCDRAVAKQFTPGITSRTDELLRAAGMALCKTATGLELVKLGPIEAHATHPKAEAEARPVGEPPRALPETMTRDEMLKYYSSYANLCAHEALQYQKRIRELEAALDARQPLPAAPLCMCKDRAASACPGEWEPGCDLGNNPAHVRVAPDQQPAAPREVAGWKWMPPEATPEMIAAVEDRSDRLWSTGAVYRAMFSAAPQEGTT